MWHAYEACVLVAKLQWLEDGRGQMQKKMQFTDTLQNSLAAVQLIEYSFQVTVKQSILVSCTMYHLQWRWRFASDSHALYGLLIHPTILP